MPLQPADIAPQSPGIRIGQLDDLSDSFLSDVEESANSTLTSDDGQDGAHKPIHTHRPKHNDTDEKNKGDDHEDGEEEEENKKKSSGSHGDITGSSESSSGGVGVEEGVEPLDDVSDDEKDIPAEMREMFEECKSCCSGYAVKCVRVEKRPHETALGISISPRQPLLDPMSCDDSTVEDMGQYIQSIRAEGAVARAGRIKVHDQLLAVDNDDVRYLETRDVVEVSTRRWKSWVWGGERSRERSREVEREIERGRERG